MKTEAAQERTLFVSRTRSRWAPRIAAPRRVKWLALASVLSAGVAQAQVQLPPPDSAGWIKIFRGDNVSDFYAYTAGGTTPPSQARQAFPGGPFQAPGGDTIKTTGSPFGQLIFRQNFSHFRMSVQFRWPAGRLSNTGVMNKIQEDDPGQGGGLPRAIECQGDPNQGIGQIWALGSHNGQQGGTWITVRARMVQHPQQGSAQAAQADSTAPEIEYGGAGAWKNLIIGYPGWRQPRPAALDNGGWVTIEVESHGKDTTRHFVDGVKTMEYRNPRIAPLNNSQDVIKYLVEGMLSVQSEGTEVWYRNWKIKLFPEDPLYEELYPVWIRNRALAPKDQVGRTGLSLQGGVLRLLSEGRPLSLDGRRAPERIRLP